MSEPEVVCAEGLCAIVDDEPKELTKDQELAAMDQMAGMGGMEYM